MMKALFTWLVGAVLISAVAAGPLLACPFCVAVNPTFAEQFESNDIVVVARLKELPGNEGDFPDRLPRALFAVEEVLKGDDLVVPEMQFHTILLGNYELGQQFLVMGVDPPRVTWSTPLKASPRVIEYLKTIPTLPESGADRLAFFQQYFEDKEELLAYDAYDEFATSTYEDVIDLKDRMDRRQLVEWIRDPEVMVNRKRLYYTMLGICGAREDADLLEQMLRSDRREDRAGLDAMIACFLSLRGSSGVDLIEELFLSNPDAEYTDTLSAIMAIRFHGTETDIIPRDRLVKSLRLVLDKTSMADMVIPDLARWEDWEVMERLVQMFKDADEDTKWLRVPIVNYLKACPKPEAKQYVEQLREIDPQAVQRAEFFFDFGEPSAVPATPPTSAGTPPGRDSRDEPDDDGDNGSGGDDGQSSAPSAGGPSGKLELHVAAEDYQAVSHVVKRVSSDVGLTGEDDAGSTAEPSGLLTDGYLAETSDEAAAVETGGDVEGSDGSENLANESVQAASRAAFSPASQSKQPVAARSDLAEESRGRTVGRAIAADQQIVATSTVASPIALIVGPIAAGLLLLLLSWSVICGWFERLIF